MIPWPAVAGTLFFWAAVAFALRGLLLFARRALRVPSHDPAELARGAVVSLVIAAVCGGASAALQPAKGLSLPIVWPVLAVQMWPLVLCVVFGVVAVGGALLDASAKDRPRRLTTALLWFGAAALFWSLPRANPEPLKFVTGHITLTVPVAIAIFGLAVAAVFAMAAAAKSARAKSLVTGLSAQVGLLTGVVVFGMPFLFLLVTSFKEDRDMSSAHGIIWVPRVVQTLPVMDDDSPYYEATYKGVRVQADLNKENPDGTLSLTIAHPVFYGGYSFDVPKTQAKRIPREMPLVEATLDGTPVQGVVFRKLPDGSQDVQIQSPESLKGRRHVFKPKETTEVRPVSLRWKNYVEALEFLPPEANYGLTYVRNTLWLVLMNVLGALVSNSLVAYAFARLKFPAKNLIFIIVLSTMMLPAAVTLLPQFLIFRELGWINTLKPLWVKSWFATAFNIFLLRQFFEQIPFELEDAAKIDGCGYLRSFWSVMVPQVKPALAVIAIMTFMAAWNDFMGPLVYSSSPETLPISYAVQLFNGERAGDPGLLMAFVTMSLAPVIALFAFAQRFFIEGVQLSGLGGR